MSAVDERGRAVVDEYQGKRWVVARNGEGRRVSIRIEGEKSTRRRKSRSFKAMDVLELS